MRLVSQGRHERGRRLPVAGPAALRRRGGGRAGRGQAAVHAVQRRSGRRSVVPGEGLDPVRPGRRHRRHGPHRRGGRLRPRDRLRHGRHLDRRLALRGGARAAVRDRGRRGADARADAVHPHGGGRRRIDPALRRRPLPGRPGLGRRRPRPGLLRPRRPADRDRRQRPARAGAAGSLPPRLRRRRRPAARRRGNPPPLRRAGGADHRRHRRPARPRAGRGRLPRDRGGEHGERDQEDLGPARLRRDQVRAVHLRRGGRPARLRGRRRPRHDQRAHPPAGGRAVGLRHRPGRRHRDARVRRRGAADGRDGGPAARRGVPPPGGVGPVRPGRPGRGGAGHPGDPPRPPPLRRHRHPARGSPRHRRGDDRRLRAGLPQPVLVPDARPAHHHRGRLRGSHRPQ